MPLVTINGQIGSGAREVGRVVARLLNADYIDRLILVEAGRRVGATVSALAEKESRPRGLMDRLVEVLQRALERSAAAGAGGEPFLWPMWDALNAEPYPEAARGPITRAQEVDDLRFFQVIKEVIQDIARGGNAVIIGRAGNLILRGTPGALHVGLVAPMDTRVRVIMERERLERPQAERYIAEQERARTAFFRRFFKASPDDPLLYDVIFNTGRGTFEQVAQGIADLALRYTTPTA